MAGDQLYAGTADGALHTYATGATDAAEQASARTGEAKRTAEVQASRRAIEQLGYLRGPDLLVMLTDGAITLSPRQRVAEERVRLAQTRGARYFAVASWREVRAPNHTSRGARASLRPMSTYSVDSAETRHTRRGARAAALRGMDDIARDRSSARDDEAGADAEAGGVDVALLLVTTRRRLVAFRWVDGHFWDTRELALPHTPRRMQAAAGRCVYMAFAMGSYARMQVPSVWASRAPAVQQRIRAVAPEEAVDATAIFPPASSTMGEQVDTGDWQVFSLPLAPESNQAEQAETRSFGAALGGLVGRGPPPLPVVVALEDEVLLGRERSGVFLDAATGRPTPRRSPFTWATPTPPLDAAYLAPYVLLVNTREAHRAEVAVHVRDTLRLAQTLPLGKNARLLAVDAGASAAPHAACVVVTQDGEPGASIVALRVRAWAEQLDALAAAGEFQEALALLDELDDSDLEHRAARRAHIQACLGVARFQEGEWDAAIDLFLEVDVNPAKVLAMYPAEVSGALARPPAEWMDLVAQADEGAAEHGHPALPPAAPIEPPSEAPSSAAALGALARFLTDRRRLLLPLLDARGASPAHAAVGVPPAALLHLCLGHDDEAMDRVGTAELAALARSVDTALFRTLLRTKPALVGPLCRVENYAEVHVLADALREHQMTEELVSLYRGRGMHREALSQLREMHASQSDTAARVGPTVQYLQELGDEDMRLLLDTAHWVLREHRELGLSIFTADVGRVNTLPHLDVVADLEAFDPDVCAAYLEHLIDADDGEPVLHTKLGTLYQRRLAAAHSDADREKAQRVLLGFLRRSAQYDAEALLKSCAEDAPEIRAQLLGRLGRHREALQLYVHELHDTRKAEAYCEEHASRDVFQLLLTLYLDRSCVEKYLDTALGFMARHAARLDLDAALALVPPECGVGDLCEFLVRALRARTAAQHRQRMVCNLSAVQDERLSAAVRALQQRRVQVTETRTCPRCHRRLGNAVVAVQPDTGRTLHYFCAHERG